MNDDRCRICGDKIPGARFGNDCNGECIVGARIVTDCAIAMGQAKFRAAVIKYQTMISAAHQQEE